MKIYEADGMRHLSRLPSSARKRLMGCVVKDLGALLIIVSCWSTSIYCNCRTGNHLISYWPVFKIWFVVIFSVLCFSEKYQCKILNMNA